jgi:hypothetical protein
MLPGQGLQKTLGFSQKEFPDILFERDRGAGREMEFIQKTPDGRPTWFGP